MKRKDDFEGMLPKKPEKECKCCCPTCRERFNEISNKLDPNHLNWVYCPNHTKNRHRDNEGFEHKDCINKNKELVVTESELVIIEQQKENEKEELENVDLY